MPQFEVKAGHEGVSAIASVAKVANYAAFAQQMRILPACTAILKTVETRPLSGIKSQKGI